MLSIRCDVELELDIPDDPVQMILLRYPDETWLANLLQAESTTPFSYSEVEATRGQIPPRYNVDRSEAILGIGDRTFELAKRAIRVWTPFHLSWLRIHAQGPPNKGILAAVVVHLGGLWWVNVSRVIYTIDEPDCFGFAYGTLRLHALTGEELFLVERSPHSGEVTYRILAFSRPRHPLARLGYPFSRVAQRRFRVGSAQAMQATIQSSN